MSGFKPLTLRFLINILAFKAHTIISLTIIALTRLYWCVLNLPL